MDPEKSLYCIDTSALVVSGRSYPVEVFPGLWDGYGELAKNGRLRAPFQVLEELETSGGEGDFAVRWVKEHSADLLLAPDEGQLEVVRELLARREFRGWVDPDKETPEADPFVVAAAISGNRSAEGDLFPLTWKVVSNERSRPDRPQVVRIPDVCSAYGVSHLRLLQFLRELGWRFGR